MLQTNFYLKNFNAILKVTFSYTWLVFMFLFSFSIAKLAVYIHFHRKSNGTDDFIIFIEFIVFLFNNNSEVKTDIHFLCYKDS